MKKLFIDTNIVIDLLAKREPFFQEASDLFSLGDLKKVQLSVSSLTIANTSYTLLKNSNSKTCKLVLRQLRLLVNIIKHDEKVIDLALNNDSFNDFEDSLQYFSALESHQDFIITRNLKDFKNSQLPVLTAGQFLMLA